MHKLLSLYLMLFSIQIVSAQTTYLNWSYAFGGFGYDFIRSMAVDHEGNVINVGVYSDTVDFAQGFVNDVRVATYNQREMFIQKLDSNGNFLWVHTFPSDSIGVGHRVVLGPSGSIYVSGLFFADSIDLDPSPQTEAYVYKGNSDQALFVLKLDSQGNYKWSFAQGCKGAYIKDMALDQSGEIFLIGSFPDTLDANPDPLVDSLIAPMTVGKNDFFIEKINTSGSFLWFKSIRSVDDLIAKDVALDQSQEPVIVGYFKDSVDFDPGPGIAMEVPNRQEDKGFILHLDRFGGFKSVGRTAGAGPARYDNLEIDAQGNIHIVGFFGEDADLDPTASGDLRPQVKTVEGWFLTKLNPSGSVKWLRHYYAPDVIPTDGFRDDMHLGLDPDGNVFIAGFFLQWLDFDLFTPYSQTLYGSGQFGGETFIAKIDSSANKIWAYKLQGLGAHPFDLVSKGHDFYLTGHFSQNIRLDPFNLAAVQYGWRAWDTFAARYNSCKVPQDTTLFEYVCNYYEVTPGQRIYKDSLLIDTIPTVGGCFNIERRQIAIYDLAKVTITNNTFKWDSSGVGPFTFSWYDCGLKQVVAGENDSIFKPTYNGQYALIVSDQNCTDTSDCYLIDDISLLDHSPLDYLSIHPNPTNGHLHLTNLPENEDYQINLCDLAGRKLEIVRSGFDINMSHLPNGVYLMTVQNGAQRTVKRVIKN